MHIRPAKKGGSSEKKDRRYACFGGRKVVSYALAVRTRRRSKPPLNVLQAEHPYRPTLPTQRRLQLLGSREGAAGPRHNVVRITLSRLFERALTTRPQRFCFRGRACDTAHLGGSAMGGPWWPVAVAPLVVHPGTSRNRQSYPFCRRRFGCNAVHKTKLSCD